jgi:RNA polymerase sigma factor (sigma-70 family)
MIVKSWSVKDWNREDFPFRVQLHLREAACAGEQVVMLCSLGSMLMWLEEDTHPGTMLPDPGDKTDRFDGKAYHHVAWGVAYARFETPTLRGTNCALKAAGLNGIHSSEAGRHVTEEQARVITDLLLRAAMKYDPSRGTTFLTYAVRWVRQGMARAMQNQSRTVRVPVHVWRDASQLDRERSRHGCSVSEAAVACGIPGKRAEGAEAAMQGVSVSLDAPRGEDGKKTMSDCIPCGGRGTEAAAMDAEAAGMLAEVLSVLPAQTRMVLEAMMEGRTLEDIGSEMGLSRERIRQVESRGIRMVRSAMGLCDA